MSILDEVHALGDDGEETPKKGALAEVEDDGEEHEDGDDGQDEELFAEADKAFMAKDAKGFCEAIRKIADSGA